MEFDDDLLATMSHELRTPLNAILGWVQLMRAGLTSPGEAERALETIERNARAETTAIDEALDLVRDASGRLPIAQKQVRWSESLRAATAAAEPIAAARHVRIDVRSDPSVRVMGDAGRLMQTARALLQSAARRSAPGSVVRVELSGGAEFGILSVSEEAAVAVLPRLESRATDPRGAKKIALGDGRGLGVALAKRVVRAHGGTMEFADEGRTVCVRIPLAHGTEATVTDRAGDAANDAPEPEHPSNARAADESGVQQRLPITGVASPRSRHSAA